MKYNKLAIFMVFALLACILTVGSVSASDTNNSTGLANSSSEYGVNNNTFQSNYTGPQTNTTKWNTTIGTSYSSSEQGSAVTGSDGTVYIGSNNGTFYAINPNGTILWTYNIGSMSSTPAISANGTIYVQTQSGTLYALTSEGSYLWNCTTGSSSGDPVIGSDGTIYVSSSATNLLYAVTPSGKIKWTYSAGGYLAPAIGSDGTIYIVTSNTVYAITDNGTNATQKWNCTLGNTIQRSSISIGSNGTLYVGASTQLYAINSSTGQIKWNITVSTYYIYGAPAISSDGTIYVATTKGTSTGTLYAITDNGTNGTVNWSYDIGRIYAYGVTPVIGADGTIYIGSFTGMYAITDNGDYPTLKWFYTMAVGNTASIGSDGTLYVINRATGVLYAFQDLTADFTSSTSNATVTFKDNSTNIPTSWNWSFGDGSTNSTEQNPTHTYTASGKYTVTLTVTNVDGVQSTTSKTVYIVLASANPVGGKYSTSQTVNLTTDDTNATIYYTTNGTDPTLYGTQYTSPLNISSTTTVKYAAVDNGTWSTIYSQTYTIAPSVTANPVGGSYNTTQTVTLTTNDTDATIYYTTNGTDPTLYGTKYTGPLTIGSTTTLKYVAVDNDNWGVVTTQTYTIVPTVTVNPVGGKYNTTKTVTLTTNNTNTTIYYTTNGTDPKLYGTKYTGPLTISKTTTLKYAAVNNGTWSTVYSQTYTIDKTAPTASTNYKSGTYNKNLNITLKMSESGTIYYTTNGATPTTSSKKYTGTFTITSTTTLKFIAVDSAGNKSPVYTAKYTIDKTAPKVSAICPTNKATGVARSKTVSIRLSENVLKGVNWSKVYIKNMKTGQKCKVSIKISGNHIYISTNSKKAALTWYQVYIPASAIKDAAGNNLAKAYTFKFKTGKK